MLRTIFGVIAGYIATAVVVMAVVTIAYSVLGPSFAFQEGSFDVTGAWVGLNLFMGFFAAILGGWIAAMVGRSRKAVAYLIALMLVLGLGLAYMQGQSPPPEAPAPAAELEPQEVARYARPPAWYAWIVPFFGAAGVLLGGRVRLQIEEIRREEAEKDAQAPMDAQSSNDDDPAVA